MSSATTNSTSPLVENECPSTPTLVADSCEEDDPATTKRNSDLPEEEKTNTKTDPEDTDQHGGTEESNINRYTPPGQVPTVSRDSECTTTTKSGLKNKRTISRGDPQPVRRGLHRTPEDFKAKRSTVKEGKMATTNIADRRKSRRSLKFLSGTKDRAASSQVEMGIWPQSSASGETLVDPELGSTQSFDHSPSNHSPTRSITLEGSDRMPEPTPNLQRQTRNREQPSPGAHAIYPFGMPPSLAGSPSQCSLRFGIDAAQEEAEPQLSTGHLAEAQPIEEEAGPTQVAVETNPDAKKKHEDTISAKRLMLLVGLSILLLGGIVGGAICGSGLCSEKGNEPPGWSVATETRYFRDSAEQKDIKRELASRLGVDYFDVSPENERRSHVRSSRLLALQWILNEDPIQLNAAASAELLQRYILVLFYFHTTEHSPWENCNPVQGGASGFCRSGSLTDVWGTPWLSAHNECQWAGVLCDESKRIIELALGSNNLNGPLPWELSKLDYLTTLDLSRNKLTSTIPTHLGVLAHSMNSFVLRRNKLKGAVPTELFSTLSGVSFSGSHFATNLDVGWNSLTGVIPSEIGRSHWQWVRLGNNMLSGPLPVELFQSTNLRSLWLDGNGITGHIPTQVGRLTRLERFSLGDSNLSGTIPSEISLLSYLQDLSLQKTKLVGTIPKELYSGLAVLKYLDISDCSFSGTISTLIGLWSRLEVFYASNNNFSGSIPEEIGSLSDLHNVTLNGNGLLAGSIPETLCALQRPIITKAHLSWTLVADCTPDATTGTPLMSCPDQCCTICCDATTKICQAN